MVRLETHRNKQFATNNMTPADLERFIAENGRFTVHEVIYQSLNKLFFDIDGT